MKKALKNIHGKMRQYWSSVMDSTRLKMSLGAQHLDRIICRAHGDQWRRRNKSHHKA